MGQWKEPSSDCRMILPHAENTLVTFTETVWLHGSVGSRKEADRACSISVSIEADVINRDEWEKIARFHAEMTKQLADYAFYPYVQELKALDNTF